MRSLTISIGGIFTAAVVACATPPPSAGRSAPPARRTATPLAPATAEAAAPIDAGSAPVAADATAEREAAPPEEDAGEPERHAFHEPLPSRMLPASAPARRIANLYPADCRKELAKRKLPVKRWHGAAKGVATPLRITGPFRGVHYLTAGGKSPYGILDCRLVLALDEAAEILASFGVARVLVGTIYRPGSRLPGKKAKGQHNYGLAADITGFVLTDGRHLTALDHWHTPIGSDPCGPDAVVPDPDSETVLLHDIVCALARSQTFNYLLTPSFNVAHADHFHFDVKRNAELWSIR